MNINFFCPMKPEESSYRFDEQLPPTKSVVSLQQNNLRRKTRDLFFEILP